METSSTYKVIRGCNTSDETRYEIGDTYDAANHTEEDTQELLSAGCFEKQAKAKKKKVEDVTS